MVHTDLQHNKMQGDKRPLEFWLFVILTPCENCMAGSCRTDFWWIMWNVNTKCQELSIVCVWGDISSASLVIVCRNVRAPQVGFTLSVATMASGIWRPDQLRTVRPMTWPLERPMQIFIHSSCCEHSICCQSQPVFFSLPFFKWKKWVKRPNKGIKKKAKGIEMGKREESSFHSNSESSWVGERCWQ